MSISDTRFMSSCSCCGLALGAFLQRREFHGAFALSARCAPAHHRSRRRETARRARACCRPALAPGAHRVHHLHQHVVGRVRARPARVASVLSGNRVLICCIRSTSVARSWPLALLSMRLIRPPMRSPTSSALARITISSLQVVALELFDFRVLRRQGQVDHRQAREHRHRQQERHQHHDQVDERGDLQVRGTSLRRRLTRMAPWCAPVDSGFRPRAGGVRP